MVSGGAGYIGSHTCIELLNAGYDVSWWQITKRSSPRARTSTAVIQFAGYKAVGESVQKPIEYY